MAYTNAPMPNFPQNKVRYAPRVTVYNPAGPAQPESSEGQSLEGPPVRANSLEQTNEDHLSPIYAEEIGKNNHELKLDGPSILNGIILSEILGKPKSRRAGR